MMELPEALTIAGQINKTIRGKKIVTVTVAHTPHKLAWYYGEPKKYLDLLVGRTLGEASALGGLVEVEAGKARVLFGEGVNIRWSFARISTPSALHSHTSPLSSAPISEILGSSWPGT